VSKPSPYRVELDVEPLARWSREVDRAVERSRAIRAGLVEPPRFVPPAGVLVDGAEEWEAA
jgi:hypothetical protein